MRAHALALLSTIRVTLDGKLIECFRGRVDKVSPMVLSALRQASIKTHGTARTRAIVAMKTSGATMILQQWFRDLLANSLILSIVEVWAKDIDMSVPEATARLDEWVSGLLSEQGIGERAPVTARHEKAGFGLFVVEMVSIFPREFACHESTVRNTDNMWPTGRGVNTHHHSISFLNVDMSQLGYTRDQAAYVLLGHISGGQLMDGFTKALRRSK